MCGSDEFMKCVVGAIMCENIGCTFGLIAWHSFLFKSDLELRSIVSDQCFFLRCVPSSYSFSLAPSVRRCVGPQMCHAFSLYCMFACHAASENVYFLREIETKRFRFSILTI